MLTALLALFSSIAASLGDNYDETMYTINCSGVLSTDGLCYFKTYIKFDDRMVDYWCLPSISYM